MKLNLEQIKEVLPHREPFLMLDRVDDYVPGDYTKAVKAVSANEWYFQGHFEDYKVMPGVLQIEAMAQAGAIAMLTLEENKGRLAFFGGIKKARFKKQVVPGDLLQIEAKITRVMGNVGFGDGKVMVDGELAAEAELIFALGDEQ